MMDSIYPVMVIFAAKIRIFGVMMVIAALVMLIIAAKICIFGAMMTIIVPMKSSSRRSYPSSRQ
jgi:hypothetical protein